MSDAQRTPVAAAFEEFDLADRMRRSLRVSGVGVTEMADYLEVERNTVSTWINGHVKPRKPTLMAWALRTGASYEWLATGCTPPDLNREPTD